MLFFVFIAAQFGFSQPQQGPPKINSGWQFGVVSFYSSKIIRRGALIQNAPALFIFPSIGYSGWSRLGQIKIGQGGGLALEHSFSKKLTWVHLLRPFNDTVNLSLISQPQNFRNTRERSWEYATGLKWRPFSKFKFEAWIHQDLKAHHGTFGSINLSIRPIPKFALLSLGGEVGFGSSKHNKYLYGQGGMPGATHALIYSSLFLPFVLPYKGVLILRYSQSYVLQTANTTAALVRTYDNLNLLFMLASWRF